MKRLILLFSFLALLGTGASVAQSHELKGTVVEKSTGEALPGVSILIKGSGTGVATDVEGRYTLTVKKGDVLIFSFMGMKTQEVTVDDRPVIDVQMEAVNRSLDEVVVVAYGVQRKEALTGAMTHVKGEKLEAATVSSLDKALQGNAAGVIATTADGTPGSFATIQIRGAGSINAGTAPLYVVDGVPVMSGKASDWSTSSNILATLNPADIESMSILKDAAATSIYGSQAANGVVLITTKQGRSGKTRINATVERGFYSPTNSTFELCSSEELLMLQREAVANARDYFNNPAYDWADPNGSYYRPDELAATNTDWWDVITRHGLHQLYDISLSGGNDKTRFFASASYMDQEGIVIGTDFSRFSARLNLEHKISKKFTFNTSLSGSTTDQNYVFDAWAYANPISAAYSLLPWESPYNEDGSINMNLTSNGGYNPVNFTKEKENNQKNLALLSTSYLNFQIFPFLNFRTTFGFDWKDTRDRRYSSEKSVDGMRDGCPIYTQDIRYYRWTSSNVLSFNKVFLEKHSADALFGYETMEYRSYYLSAEGAGANDDIPLLSAASKDFKASEGITDYASISLFGRMNYNYDSRYYFSASFRRDGSSRFGADNRWANFWSVGGAWKISGEPFMKDFGWMDLLKLRASYGTTGNSSIDAYASKGLYKNTTYGGEGGLVPSQKANPQLGWEQSATTNLAVDFGFLNRISGSVEYFWKKTSDLLLKKRLSYTSGLTSIMQNTGEVMNRGLEFQVSADIFRDSEFKWRSELNMTFPSSEVLDLGGESEIWEGNYQKRRVNGKSFTEWYMPHYAGVNPADGMAMWYDKDGGLTENYAEARYEYLGSPEPDFYGGFTNTFSWKGLSLSFMFYFTYGGTVKFNDRYYLEGDGADGFSMNLSREQLKRWQKPGDITSVPKPILGNPSKSRDWYTSRWLDDGSYIRLRNLTLAYDLPKPVLNYIGLEKLSVYFKGTNLWTHTNAVCLDPEVGIYGSSSNVYPNARSFVFGLNIGI